MERQVAADLGERGQRDRRGARLDGEPAADLGERGQRDRRGRRADGQVAEDPRELRQLGRRGPERERAGDDVRAPERGDLHRVGPVARCEVAPPQLERGAHERRPIDLGVGEHAVAVVVDARLHGEPARRALQRRRQRILADQHRRRRGAVILDALDLGVVEDTVRVSVLPQADHRAAELTMLARWLGVALHEQRIVIRN